MPLYRGLLSANSRVIQINTEYPVQTNVRDLVQKILKP